MVTVAEALDAAGDAERTGGLAYLGELAANTPSAANIKRYAEIVRERSVLRQLVDKVVGPSRHVSDHALHGGAVQACARRTPLAEALQRDLDRCRAEWGRQGRVLPFAIAERDVELEEAFATTSSLPANLQAPVGGVAIAPNKPVLPNANPTTRRMPWRRST